ncbi:hypothetical protein EMCG_02564 [[Emmonsia] crescens]|uniref:Uncharacterized protein n=1 Tax=[Emmonsia] crescens TaxID=73230 RepID=A0A0G2HY76_9EURO|nr:hypothetical protein EMCG_02564 [Emmonsia crescens UAMH 3008]
MPAPEKRKAPDEEDQQQEQEQPPRKLPERRSRISGFDYNVNKYYRGMGIDVADNRTRKISPTLSQKRDDQRRLGNTGPESLDPNTQTSTFTPPTLRTVTPGPMWESCFECVKELCRNPRVMRCQKGSDGSKCRHCDATHKICLPIPQILMPRLVAIQKIASSIITSPNALGWSDEVSHRKKCLREEYNIFQKEIEGHIAGTEMMFSPVPSHNASGLAIGTRTAIASTNTADRTLTSISSSTASVATPDTILEIPTLPSTPSTVNTHISFATIPFSTLATAKFPIMLPSMADRGGVTSSTPHFPRSTNNNNNEDLRSPRAPTASPPKLNEYSAPPAQIEDHHRDSAAEENTTSSSITVAAEQHNMGDIQTTSTDSNTAPFAMGAELLTVLRSIESNLARVADALEATNSDGNGGDSGSRSGGRKIVNRAYWE